MTDGHAHPNYTAVFVWLLALLGVGVAASLVPGGRSVGLVVIFATAFVKALLVALNFMHLRFESGVIYAIALVPLVFAAILAVALFPDFVWHVRPAVTP
jgi:caa(3)-type oxidase subunit IV